MSDKSKTKLTQAEISDVRQSASRAVPSHRVARTSKGKLPEAEAQAEATAVAARTNTVDEGLMPRETKKNQLVALLSTKAGADVAMLSTALGWQMHTTRAALTGLRKTGHTLEASRAAGRTSNIYRIVPGTGPSRGGA